MKKQFWLPITVSALVTVLVFCSNKKMGSDDSLLVKITGILRQEHYSAPEIDDNFSKKVYKNVLEKIDNDKRFFTQKEIAYLQKYETSLDDQILAGRYDFFDSTWTMLMKRLDKLEVKINAEMETKFDFTGNDSYTQKDKVESFQTDETALNKDWSHWLKFQTIDRLYRKVEAQKAKQNRDSAMTPAKIYPMDTLELQARNETKKFCNDWFKRWRKMSRKEQVAFYVNCIAEVYDPHTSYFPPEEKANFDISMTGKLEGIGATLSEKDGYIKIERIVPGSPSFKQGELKAGDLIVKVAQGAKDPVDVVDMRLDDAIQMIRGKKGTEVRLTVKKPDGTFKVIPIIRDIIVIEESYARSAIIRYKKQKIGVINLPSFYADFSDRGRGRHSSEDVKMELEKLKKEGVDGIVLDLRNNGGGSLQDAIEMGGLFIKSGPIVQVREPNGKARSGGDPDDGIVYSGPLTILTNKYSASASEILAAALQDYKRAIVVGSKSTFGKGTVQTFMPIEGGESTLFPKGYGQIKVTIQKFYRIDGGTTQLRGVIPDVILPDLYDGIPQGEEEMEFHLAYDVIPKAPYTLFNGLFSAKMAKAIASGNKSIASSDHFQKVKGRSVEIKKLRDEFAYSLNLDKYTAQQTELKAIEKKYADPDYKSFIESIDALAADMASAKGDAAKVAQRTDWLKMYKKDAGLDQAVLVLKDLIK